MFYERKETNSKKDGIIYQEIKEKWKQWSWTSINDENKKIIKKYLSTGMQSF